MATSGNIQRNSDQPSINNTGSERNNIHRILQEVGLNPSDYILSPVPPNNPPEQSNSNKTSAFTSYSPVQHQHSNQSASLNPQSNIIHNRSRPITYVQQPPPTQPFFPPPQPVSQPPATGLTNPVPSSGQSLLSFLTRHNNTDAPPPPPQVQQQPPPQVQQPPPPSSLESQPTASQEFDTMHRSVFSPRRTPPPPPQFTSLPQETASAEHYLQQINSQDVPPVKVIKPNTQNVVYRKEIRIRYLQPPTPPPPAPIIIREKHELPPPPQSPLLIRERKPEARTPPPLTIRERPPTPPAPLEPYIIEKSIPPPPPPARQIIIERLPTPPPKPRTVIFEKWLPYKKLKRPVLLQKAPPMEPIKPTRNVIIEYEPLKAFTVRRVIEEGVFRVDPHEYSTYNAQSGSSNGDVRIVERIEDLPPPSEQLMRVLNDYNHPSQRSSSYLAHSEHHSGVAEHVPQSIQQLLADARPVSNADPLINISRASSIPAHRQEQVLSTGYSSSNPSPTIVPMNRSRSKHSSRHSQPYTPHDSLSRSNLDDIY